jgi:hypothetical protein
MKNRWSFLVFCIVFLLLSLFAQLPKPSWLVNIDAYNDCNMADIEVDKEGNSYAAFNYQGSLN